MFSCGMTGGEKGEKMIIEICAESTNTCRNSLTTHPTKLHPYTPPKGKQLVTFIAGDAPTLVKASPACPAVNHLIDFPFRALFGDQLCLRWESVQWSPAGLLVQHGEEIPQPSSTITAN